MGRHEKSSSGGKGWGPFSSRQLTTIVCVAIVAAVMIPTAAMAAIGAFTSTTVTPAVTGTNSATVANAKGVQGTASATSAGVTRYGVAGNASGTFGIGVQGTGTKYGVFSNGPLGVAAGKSLSCTACITGGDLAASTRRVTPSCRGRRSRNGVGIRTRADRRPSRSARARARSRSMAPTSGSPTSLVVRCRKSTR